MPSEADPGEIPNAGAFVKYEPSQRKPEANPLFRGGFPDFSLHGTVEEIASVLRGCHPEPALEIGRDVRNAAQRCILATGKEAARLYLGRRQIAAIEEQGRRYGTVRDDSCLGNRAQYNGLPVFEVDADDHCEAGL